MRALFILAAAFCAAVAAMPAAADDHSIVVNGTASLSIAPDFAVINLGVISKGNTVADALKDNNERMSRVVAAIRLFGISEADMQTSKFTVDAVHPVRSAEYGYDETKTIGYSVSNRIKIKVGNLDKVAKVIDATLAAGANYLESVDFDIKNRNELEDQALADAVKNARHRAEIMAGAEGAQVGQMIAMTNTERSYRGGVETVTVTSSKMVSTPILPGSIDLTTGVTVTYAIR
jgi:uncharacterized protein YggE